MENSELRLVSLEEAARIEREFQRAVTKRTEQGDNPYEETILHLTK